MDLFDWLTGRSSVKHKQADGVSLALQTVEKFEGRTFRIRGLGMRHSNIPDTEIIRFIRKELPGYYTYTTKVKTYTDRKDIQQVHIQIKGTVSITRELSRYNPLDRTFTIKTEKLTNADLA